MLYWVTQGVLDWSAVTHPVVMDHGVARDGQVKGLTSPLSPCMEAAPALWGRHAAAVDCLRLFSREVVEAAVKPNPNPATHTHARTQVEERGAGFSLQRAFQRYEALGRDGRCEDLDAS
jgi:hypothetical protein